MFENHNEVVAFRTWLAGQKFSVKPSLKINQGFDQAAVVVDFGTPKEPLEFPSEFISELADNMRNIAGIVTGRRSQRFHFDNSNGVFWTSSNYR
jgi:hypothetical protein